MLINWIKKKVLKSIIKDITKQLPKYKEIAELYIEQHKDEILDKIKESNKDLIMNEVAKALNK